jgi:mannan polymerase II complex MNN11 subunit
VQWHPTILAKLALVPQKVLNSNGQDDEYSTSIYTEGDFVVRFNGCEVGGDHDCETEARPYMKEWRKLLNIQG